MLDSHIYLGIDLGKLSDPAAFAAIEAAVTTEGKRNPVTYDFITAVQFRVRYLRRLPLGTPYPIIAREINTLLEQSAFRHRTTAVIDAGGPGIPFLDYFRPAANLIKVAITGSGDVTYSNGFHRVPRQALLHNLAILLQKRVLAVANLACAPDLFKELAAIDTKGQIPRAPRRPRHRNCTGRLAGRQTFQTPIGSNCRMRVACPGRNSSAASARRQDAAHTGRWLKWNSAKRSVAERAPTPVRAPHVSRWFFPRDPGGQGVARRHAGRPAHEWLPAASVAWRAGARAGSRLVWNGLGEVAGEGGIRRVRGRGERVPAADPFAAWSSTGKPVRVAQAKSVFTRPIDGAVLSGRRLIVRGAAWAGENRVAKVEVSTDGGTSWAAARVPESRPYCWALWQWEWRIPRAGEYRLVVRAADERCNSQPAQRDSRRLDSYEQNEWQRIAVTAV